VVGVVGGGCGDGCDDGDGCDSCGVGGGCGGGVIDCDVGGGGDGGGRDNGCGVRGCGGVRARERDIGTSMCVFCFTPSLPPSPSLAASSPTHLRILDNAQSTHTAIPSSP